MRHAIIAAYRIRGLMYYIGAAVLIVAALTGSIPLDDATQTFRAILSLIAVAVMAASVVLTFLGPRLLPPVETAVVHSPVQGRWLAMNSPATKVPSHGVRMS